MGAEIVVAVVFVIIFVIGVTVGFISVIALSSVRADKLEDHGKDETTGVPGAPGHSDGAISDAGPRWPGRRDDRDGDLFGGKP